MAEETNLHYPFVCWAAWRAGDEHAALELVCALRSPDLIVRMITRAILVAQDIVGHGGSQATTF